MEARYLLVIVQYVAKLNSHKLFHFVRHQSAESQPSSSPSSSSSSSTLALGRRSDFRVSLTDSETSARLTGFSHNAIAPIGLKYPLKVILDAKIAALSPAFFWAGGGDADLKLFLTCRDFINHTGCFVADITN